MGIYIGNENAICDDDFDLYLNGTVITTIDETDTRCMQTTCRGTLVLPSNWSGATMTITGLGGFGLEFCQTKPINLAYKYVAALNDPPCSNTLRLKSNDNHACNNYGRTRVYWLRNNGGNLTVVSILLNAFYIGGSGTMDNSYSFSRPC